PTVFSRKGILEAVIRHVVCGDQALAVADDTPFPNCLVVMRPKTKKSKLASRASVRVKITNGFINYIDTLK
ncbi:hypothetical protein LXA43DRAFT_872631, partial [Ganoderma leucocontextum]